MRSAAAALSWQLWWHRRAALALLGAYLGVLALATHLPAAPERRHWLFMAAIPLGLGCLFFLAALALPEGDVTERESSFPRFLLTLPLPTRELAFWPMLHAAVAAALAWVLPVRLLLHPLGVEAPLAWPAALLAALLAWLQALLWSPMGWPYVRVVLTLAGCPLLVSAGVQAALDGVPGPVLTGAFLLLAAAAHPVAWLGLARTRRGDIPHWPVPGRTRRSGQPALAFPTPEAAQAWYAARAGGLTLPLAVAVVCTLLSLPLLGIRETIPLALGAESLEVNLWIRFLLYGPFLPPALAALLGFARRGYGDRSGLPPLLATRPVPEAALVTAHWRAALRSVLAAWGVLLLFLAGWLLVPARSAPGGRPDTGPLLLLLGASAGWQDVLSVALLTAMLVGWTWKSLVQGLAADLCPQPWIHRGIPLAAHSVVFAAVIAYVHWRLDTPVADPSTPIPGWLLGLAGLKLAGLAAWPLLLRRLPSSCRPRHGRWYGAWAGAVLLLFLSLTYLSHPSGALGDALTALYLPHLSTSPPAAHLGLAVLAMPLHRLLAAAPALASLRCR